MGEPLEGHAMNGGLLCAAWSGMASLYYVEEYRRSACSGILAAAGCCCSAGEYRALYTLAGGGYANKHYLFNHEDQ